MKDAVLVINAGSSSIRFAVFESAGTAFHRNRVLSGMVDGIGARARLVVSGAADGGGAGSAGAVEPIAAESHAQAFDAILERLEASACPARFVAAGHRVVHGGTVFSKSVRVDDRVAEQLKVLAGMAPLHQSPALHAIEILKTRYPSLPQVACFDTAFHAGMPRWEQCFALPRSMLKQGIRRYGFHGLSYEYICSVLPDHLGDEADGRIVIAHLGHGVSMCAVRKRQSIATTMSFTPLDGLPMGTRSGAIDPAIVLYLLEQGASAPEISDLLHHRSGLLGLSGISGDMRTLLSSTRPEAAEAVEFFCYRISRELGSLAAALGGLDALVFTGGIGEHAGPVRARVCRSAEWLGIGIDPQANESDALRISAADSKVQVWVIPTDEAAVIARSTMAILSGKGR